MGVAGTNAAFPNNPQVKVDKTESASIPAAKLAALDTHPSQFPVKCARFPQFHRSTTPQRGKENLTKVAFQPKEKAAERWRFDRFVPACNPEFVICDWASFTSLSTISKPMDRGGKEQFLKKSNTWQSARFAPVSARRCFCFHQGTNPADDQFRLRQDYGSPHVTCGVYGIGPIRRHRPD